jgi:hypothetical protein
MFFKLAASSIFGTNIDWVFRQDRAGWSGVNLSNETYGEDGWCFAPQIDPNLYGPPMRVGASAFKHLEISMSSGIGGDAQLFYRGDVSIPYAEENSLQFSIEPGEQTYSISLQGARGWAGTIAGLRIDPVEQGIPTSLENRVCVKEVRLVP